MFRHTALAAALLALLGTSVQAGNDTLFGNTPVSPAKRRAMVDDAERILAERNGRPARKTRRAYTELNNARNAGSAEAWGVMGDLYLGGEGVRPVPFIANDYFWMGALSSDPESMYQTALRRFATPGGYAEGKMWLKRAADAGHPRASFDWAMREFEACQYKVGKAYLATALEAGLLDARFFLAESYLKGDNGFEKSPERAFGVYKALADEGNAEAMYLIGRMFQYGALGGEQAQNNRAAVYWYASAADHQSIPGAKAYAQMLSDGVGVDPDPEQARWLTRYANALERNRRRPADSLIGLSRLQQAQE